MKDFVAPLDEILMYRDADAVQLKSTSRKGVYSSMASTEKINQWSIVVMTTEAVRKGLKS